MAGAYPEEDAATRIARQLVESFAGKWGAATPLGDVQAELVERIKGELQQMDFDARTDERTECIGIIHDVFPGGHVGFPDAQEAIFRIRRRDTQP